MKTKLGKLSTSWRIVVALALVFSMVPALAVSMAGKAAADGPVITLMPSDFEIQQAGDGTATWETEFWHSAYHSAQLAIPESYVVGDVGRVAVPHYCSLNGITSLSYYYYVGAATPQTASVYDGFIKGNAIVEPSGGGYAPAYGGPYLIIELDADHDGAKDTWVIQAQWASTTKVTWLQDTINPAVSPFHVVSLLGASPFPLGTDWGSLNEVKAASVGPYPLGTAKVLKVKIAVGEWNPVGPTPPDGPVEAYIDDVEINGQVWDMEPTTDDCARTGEAVQVFVDDISANTEGTAVDEMSTTDPNDTTSTFDVAHAPKAVGTTSAKDLGGSLTVTGVAQTATGGTVTITETPPAEYGLLSCSAAVSDINPSPIYPTTPTQLTVTSLDNDTNCAETAPGTGEYMYIFITGTTGPNGTGTPINELLYILGTDTEETTTQTFGTIIAYGVDATYSTSSAATALKISAENHVWVTYDWHQADTVTVRVECSNEDWIDVECIEVDPVTLLPDKDSGFFKGTFYLWTLTIPEHNKIKAEHCNTITATYGQYADSIYVDNVPPVMSTPSPYPSTNESLPEISVDIVDEKCPVREDSLRFFFDGTEYFDFDWDGTTLTWTPASTLTDGTYYVTVKAADCCWNWAQYEWCFEVESSPPMLIDAITGWTWAWGGEQQPLNTHTRTSIMVVFSEKLNPTTVQASDFRVNNIQPMAAEYHDYNWDCNDGHWYGLVFLTLSTPLHTDAGAPDGPVVTVKQYGVVEDLAGNPCDKEYSWTCDTTEFELELPQTVTAQDGIGPVLTVTASPEDPGYNETVIVTATSSEPLSEAYLYIGTGSPRDYNWDDKKPIGWPPVPPHQDESAWTGKNWIPMTEGVTANVWTATFTNTFSPDDNWFVEVAGHDFTQWWVDMDPGTWQDYSCVDHNMCWKHEKWSEESLLFWGRDAASIWLCEGWNLISVPSELTDPTLQGIFGTRGLSGGITKVYYYTGGAYGTWKYAALNPVTGMWTGTIISIEPGKAYWIWCSPPELRLIMTLAPIDPLAPPATYSLSAGWNMIGFTNWNRLTTLIHEYLASLTGNAQVTYRFDSCESDPSNMLKRSYWDREHLRWSGQFAYMTLGKGYWLYLLGAGLFGP